MKNTLRKILLISGIIAYSAGLYASGTVDDVIIRAWRLTDRFTEKQNVEIDTMITAFHINNPLFRQGISFSFLGNNGLAGISNFFPERGRQSDFIFIDPFSFYLNHSSETKYYNTKRPFSLLDFSTGGPRGKNEKILNILHTQNVNPDFNLGFRYFNINSDGQYQNQQAITNAISLFSSYELDNYQVHASVNLNSARAAENGGFQNDASLLNKEFETEDHAVRLQNARNAIRNTSILVSQSWQPFFHSESDTASGGFKAWFSGFHLYHILEFDRYSRIYEDRNPSSGFYPEILINNSRTFDSVYYRSLTNNLMAMLPEFRRGSVSFSAKAGLRNELLKGSYNIVPDTLFSFNYSDPPFFFLTQPADYLITDREERKYQSNALIAFARGSIGDVFGIWGEGSLYFQGHRAGEYDIQAGISFNLLEGKNQSVIEAGIRQRERTLPLFINTFSSNHFSWQNDFRKPGESTLKGTIRIPGRNFGVSANLSLLNNYIYFDSTANPAQYSDVFPVLSFSLNKDFRMWRFHFRNKINYQITGRQEILPLPELSVYHSTWFEQTLIRNILIMQIGFDLYYSNEYKGYAYQPAISQFYLQNERTFGNYPYLDVFINFKHKRTRVFFKGEHVNTGFPEPDYFSVLHYPRNQRVFKFGLSWSFYN